MCLHRRRLRRRCFILLPRSSSEVASKVGENCPTVAVVVSTPYLVGERRTQALTRPNSGRHGACSQVYDDGKRRRGLQEFFSPPFDGINVHRFFRTQCFIHQYSIHGVDDFSAPLCVCLFTFIQSAPVFICEVHSELIDVAERCVEDGVPELCDVSQIRTCAFEPKHQIIIDATVNGFKLQFDHRLP